MTALGRADLVLGAFDADHPDLSLAGLTARTGLPRTTVFRIASNMLAVGWLVRRNGRYRVGDRLFELGSTTRPHARLRRHPAAGGRDLRARPPTGSPRIGARAGPG